LFSFSSDTLGAISSSNNLAGGAPRPRGETGGWGNGRPARVIGTTAVFRANFLEWRISSPRHQDRSLWGSS
jgi:hypothetical protein